MKISGIVFFSSRARLDIVGEEDRTLDTKLRHEDDQTVRLNFRHTCISYDALVFEEHQGMQLHRSSPSELRVPMTKVQVIDHIGHGVSISQELRQGFNTKGRHENPMHDDISISTNGRGEVCVQRGRQSIMMIFVGRNFSCKTDAKTKITRYPILYIEHTHAHTHRERERERGERERERATDTTYDEVPIPQLCVKEREHRALCTHLN